MQALFAPQTSLGSRRSWIFWLLIPSPILLIIVVSISVTRVRGITARAEREVQVFRQRLASGVFREKSDPGSRNAWIRDVRTALESDHIGWAMWDYHGGFGVQSEEHTSELQ